MKAQSLAAVTLVLLTFAGAAQAGPISTLYATPAGVGSDYIFVVQGNNVTHIRAAYYDVSESPIAVYGDIRTIGKSNGQVGGQYTLGLTPTGASYAFPSVINAAFDSTSDGTHNYLVDYDIGAVYQTARNYTNPVLLFTLNKRGYVGITYDAANRSLWISPASSTYAPVADYSLNGALLSSFSVRAMPIGGLALDPADQTLWLVNYFTGNLEQYSQAGVLLSTGPGVGQAYGLEFNLAPTPEPGTFVLFGSGILGLAGLVRRKINL